MVDGKETCNRCGFYEAWNKFKIDGEIYCEDCYKCLTSKDAVYKIRLPKEDRQLLGNLPGIMKEYCRHLVETHGGTPLWNKYKNIDFKIEWI